MVDEYIRVKTINVVVVAKVFPETNNCWKNAGLVFAMPAFSDEPRIFDLCDATYITEKEYFKGMLKNG